jgi:nucleotide-binding universal stress UspA family protein
MYKRILAAVNEFTNSEIAARYAIALATSCKAKLSFAFVAEERIDKEALRRAEASLERLFIEAGDRGVEAESVIEKGDTVKKIVELVRKSRIDIVFNATRREDTEMRFFEHTIARDLMIKLPCSVAMVRAVRIARGYPKNILVPLRGRMTHLEERAYFVAKLAEAIGSKITLFYSASKISGFLHGEVHLKPVQREKHVPEDLAKFTEFLDRYEVHHEKRTGYGTISRAITIEAAHRRNDLIVMGASERSLLRSIISGNPVEDVLRETPCNLIILKPKH